MTFSRYTRLLTVAILPALTVPALAQETLDEPDPEAKAQIEAQGFRLPPQLRQVQYRDANPWVLHTNIRMGSADSSVSFGGLGAIPASEFLPGADQADFPLRSYDDGEVRLDTLRPNEVDEAGNQTSTPGGVYFQEVEQIDGSVRTNQFNSFTPGQTRSWGYLNPEQDNGDGTISMNSFSTQSTGAAFQRDAESSELGFEMAVSRRLMNFGRKVELNLSGSVGLSDFGASTSQRISADLVTLTDVYRVIGDVPSPANFPTFDGVLSGPGGTIIGSVEDSPPLQQVTQDRRFSTVADGADVEGAWSIDGSYYSFRFGPELRGHLTERIAFAAGAGVLGALVGSDFSVAEILDLDGYPTLRGVGFRGTDSVSEFLVGYYAEVSIEYWITQRTGFFLGAVIESLDDFVQTFGGRTAAVAIGDATLVRVGIVHRF
jgi:hypothetical protein